MREYDLPCGCYLRRVKIDGHEVIDEMRCAEHAKMELDAVVEHARHRKPRKI